jgi:hypothetical protein
VDVPGWTDTPGEVLLPGEAVSALAPTAVETPGEAVTPGDPPMGAFAGMAPVAGLLATAALAAARVWGGVVAGATSGVTVTPAHRGILNRKNCLPKRVHDALLHTHTLSTTVWASQQITQDDECITKHSEALNNVGV